MLRVSVTVPYIPENFLNFGFVSVLLESNFHFFFYLQNFFLLRDNTPLIHKRSHLFSNFTTIEIGFGID